MARFTKEEITRVSGISPFGDMTQLGVIVNGQYVVAGGDSNLIEEITALNEYFEEKKEAGEPELDPITEEEKSALSVEIMHLIKRVVVTRSRAYGEEILLEMDMVVKLDAESVEQADKTLTIMQPVREAVDCGYLDVALLRFDSLVSDPDNLVGSGLENDQTTIDLIRFLITEKSDTLNAAINDYL